MAAADDRGHAISRLRVETAGEARHAVEQLRVGETRLALDDGLGVRVPLGRVEQALGQVQPAERV